MSLSPPYTGIGGYPVTIDCADESQTVRESWPEGGPRVTVRYRCDAHVRYNVVAYLKGFSILKDGKIVRQPPHRYPPSPNLVCTEVQDIELTRPRTIQDGPLTGWPDHETCVIVAVYTVPTWAGWDAGTQDGQNDPSGELWTTTKTKVSGQVIQPPGGTYFWVTGPDSGSPLAEAQIGVITAQIEIEITRRWVPFQPIQQAQAFMGNVNASPLVYGNTTFAAGQLLFLGMDTEPDKDGYGTPVWNITYRLFGLNRSWNSVLARDGAYHLINSSAGGGGNTPFPYSDYYLAFP